MPAQSAPEVALLWAFELNLAGYDWMLMDSGGPPVTGECGECGGCGGAAGAADSDNSLNPRGKKAQRVDGLELFSGCGTSPVERIVGLPISSNFWVARFLICGLLMPGCRHGQWWMLILSSSPDFHALGEVCLVCPQSQLLMAVQPLDTQQTGPPGRCSEIPGPTDPPRPARGHATRCNSVKFHPPDVCVQNPPKVESQFTVCWTS